MDKKSFYKLLDDNENPLVFDGAMGTMLHNRGESLESCLDYLNISNPALVKSIYSEYIEAGAQVILTNTFGANRFKLIEQGLENKLDEINCAGVNLAKKAVETSSKNVLIAGNVGPLGVRLAPYGRVQRDEARTVFNEQIKSLVICGVDLIVIETISDLHEIREAILAAQEVSEIPIVASMTFTRDDRTLLGDTPTKVAKELNNIGADVIGVNCSGGPTQALRIIAQMRLAVPEARFYVKPNAGWPAQIGGGRIMYPAGPDYFGEYALAFRHAGAAIIGGCCGTTPEHIAAMRTALDTTSPKEYAPTTKIRVIKPIEITSIEKDQSTLSLKLSEGKFVVSVEMDPPRGLSTHKIHAGASLLAEAGADVINVADSPMARMRMSPWAVCDLIQRNLNIETTLHFPTRGRNLLRIQGDLLATHAIGVRNVFVVMGDPTEIGDYPEAMDNFDLAPSGLIKLIKKGFNRGVDHSGTEIGEPTSFFVGSAINLTPKDPLREIKVLRRKIRNGADFFLTQPIYNPETLRNFLKLYQDTHGPFEKPILMGVLPLYNARHANFLRNEVPGITIPEESLDRIKKAGKESPQEGVNLAVEMINEVKSLIQGIYLMPAFNRFELAAEIIENVKE